MGVHGSSHGTHDSKFPKSKRKLRGKRQRRQKRQRVLNRKKGKSSGAGGSECAEQMRCVTVRWIRRSVGIVPAITQRILMVRQSMHLTGDERLGTSSDKITGGMWHSRYTNTSGGRIAGTSINYSPVNRGYEETIDDSNRP